MSAFNNINIAATLKAVLSREKGTGHSRVRFRQALAGKRLTETMSRRVVAQVGIIICR